MAISPDKTEEPSTCCDADTRLELKTDAQGNYVAREYCSSCDDELDVETNI